MLKKRGRKRITAEIDVIDRREGGGGPKGGKPFAKNKVAPRKGKNCFRKRGKKLNPGMGSPLVQKEIERKVQRKI